MEEDVSLEDERVNVFHLAKLFELLPMSLMLNDHMFNDKQMINCLSSKRRYG